jgi:hypothetical protein
MELGYRGERHSSVSSFAANANFYGFRLKKTWAYYQPNEQLPCALISTSELRSKYYKRRRVTDQLQEYLEECVSVENVEPLQYWKLNSGRWPELARMALDHLVIQASSASSERSFSSGNEIVTDRRNRLNVDSIEACVCLKSWLNEGLLDGKVWDT